MTCKCPGNAAKGINHVEGCTGYLPDESTQWITQDDVETLLAPFIARLEILESRPKRGRPRAHTKIVEG